MLAQDVMRVAVPYVTEEATATYAAQLMRHENVGFLPVVADEHTRRVVGVITDRDLAMEVIAEDLAPHDVPVGLIASRVLVSAVPGDELADVERKMAMAEVRRLPVLDDQGRLLGVISLHDIAQYESEAKTGEIFREVSKTSARAPDDL